jgi:hypothetical protein
MVDYFRTIVTSQFEAALHMLHDCLEHCPAAHWEGKVAAYRFWEVAYHVSSFADYYLSESEAAFVPRAFHPPQAPGAEFNDEPMPNPSLGRAELLAYVQTCRRKAVDALAAETEESLRAPARFRRREAMSRGELHLYNLRHVQHHTGQLSAYVRRVEPGADPRWFGRGWA